MIFFRAIPILWQLAAVAGIITAIGLVYGIWHHTIYKSGYQACEVVYRAAADAQKAKADAEIAKIGEKYAPIHEKLRQSPDYMRPVSPLVGSIIGGLPTPAPRPH